MTLDELDKLAAAADTDTWKFHCEQFSVDDSLFIAACSPERIRALIAVARIERDANDALRSAYQIAARHGEDTNWVAYVTMVEQVLKRQHEVRHALDEEMAK